MEENKIILQSIGIIHTPWLESAPFRDFEEAPGDFFVELNPEFTDGLFQLDQFTHIFLIFCFDRQNKPWSLQVFPPRGNGIEVGLFASRSPNRINPVGLTITRIKRVEGNRIFTSGLDILDGTPLLDIKPYIPDNDMKGDAGRGWIPGPTP